MIIKEFKNGLQLKFPEEPTQEEILQRLNDRSELGRANLVKGPKVEYIQAPVNLPSGMPTYGGAYQPPLVKVAKEESPKTFYTREISRYLNIPKSSFSYKGGLKGTLRSKVAMLQTLSSKAYLVAREYGKENVRPVSIQGEQTLLFKDVKGDNKWKLIDSDTFELADVTSDFAGGALPITSGIVFGLLASVFKTPALGVPVGVAAEFGVGLVQDRAVRNMLDIPEDIGENFVEALGRRSYEALINAGVETLMLGTGRVARPFVFAKKTASLAEKELAETAILLNPNATVPRALDADGGVQAIREVASKFPDSAAGNFLRDLRERINTSVKDQMGLSDVDPIFLDKLLERSLINMSTQVGADKKVLTDALELLSEEGSSLNVKAASEATAIANAEARQVFSDLLNRTIRSSKVLTDDVLIEPQGQTFRNFIIRSSVINDARINNLYEQGYKALEGVDISSSKIQSIFNRAKNQAILNENDEVIQVLAPQGLTTAGRAADSLDTIVSDGITFRQLDSLIRDFNAKAGFGSVNRTPSQISYGNMAEELKGIKQTVLNRKSTPNEGKRLLKKAEDLFRQTSTLYREPNIRASTKLVGGESLKDARDYATKALAEGRELGVEFDRLLPSSRSGIETLNLALTSPTTIKDFLRVVGRENLVEARNILRTAFLSKKGIIASDTMNVNAFKMTPEDESIISTLWSTPKDKDIFNAKIQTFRKIAKIVEGKEEFIDGLTKENADRILKADSLPTIKRLEEIGVEEARIKAEQVELAKDKFVTMIAKGDVPFLTQGGIRSIAVVEDFAYNILNSSNADFLSILARARDAGADGEKVLIQSILQSLMKRSGSKSAVAKMGSDMQSLWNPQMLAKDLIDYEGKLIKLLGQEGYDNITRLNDSFVHASTLPKDKIAEAKIRVAGSRRGATLFAGGIQDSVKIRLNQLILYNQLKNPIKVKKMLEPESYDKLNNFLFGGLFVAGRFPDMLFQADADPQFNAWINDTYANIMYQASLNDTKPMEKPELPEQNIELLIRMSEGVMPSTPSVQENKNPTP